MASIESINDDHSRVTCSYLSPRESPMVDIDEDRCDNILEELVGLKLLSTYSNALKTERILVEAQCLAADLDQIRRSPETIPTTCGDKSTFASDEIWASWRSGNRDGQALERATEKVETDGDISSSIFDWIVENHRRFDLRSNNPGFFPRRASTPPIPANLPPDCWGDESPMADSIGHYMHAQSPPSVKVLPAASILPNATKPTIPTTKPSDSEMLRAQLDAQLEAAHLKRSLKLQAEKERKHNFAEEADVVSILPSNSLSIPHHDELPDHNHLQATTTPMPSRNNAQTPKVHTNRTSGRKRMHRCLKKIPPKKFEDSLVLSDDEANDYADFDHMKPPSDRPKKARWAQNKKDWENLVKRQQSIDPHSIFGWGSAPIEFREVFQTPDFRRAAADLAKKQDPKCSVMLTQSHRSKLEEAWHTDSAGFCLIGKGVTADQLQEYRSQYESKGKQSVASLVWDERWQVCEDYCQHNSALRQPWFRIENKHGSACRNLRGTSPCVGGSGYRSAETLPAPNSIHEELHSLNANSQPEKINKVNWLSKVLNYGGDGTPSKNTKRSDPPGGKRVTGGLLKGISGSFNLPSMRDKE